MSNLKVGIIMGSDSDFHAMKGAVKVLGELGIESETHVVSAHRTPDRMYDYAKSAKERGISVIIAGAGGAAHLPGMVAAIASVPVIGVPVKSKSLGGMDSLLSIAQMPPGVPVATVEINGGESAGLLAARILGLQSPDIQRRLAEYAKNMKEGTEFSFR